MEYLIFWLSVSAGMSDERGLIDFVVSASMLALSNSPNQRAYL